MSSKRRGQSSHLKADPNSTLETDPDKGGDGDGDPTPGCLPERPRFVPPSISPQNLFRGTSYTFHSPVPDAIQNSPLAAVTIGIDEAGRGPVLGHMVYGLAYCLSDYEKSLSSKGFDDSKKLTPSSRIGLMQDICSVDSDTEVHTNLGWAVRMMSARDIGAGMLRPVGVGVYNLNAQAHDATINLIREVIANGVNVKQIYVDTVGPPATYQAKLARIFPSCKVTVSKKADSIYPSVSAASVAAKVSRDLALEHHFKLSGPRSATEAGRIGSGYPSDPKTVAWLRASMDELFGWGLDTRFSWSTAADMLKRDGKPVEWSQSDEGNIDIASLMISSASSDIRYWFGKSLTLEDL